MELNIKDSDFQQIIAQNIYSDRKMLYSEKALILKLQFSKVICKKKKKIGIFIMFNNIDE